MCTGGPAHTDMSSRITQCQQRCTELTGKLDRRFLLAANVSESITPRGAIFNAIGTSGTVTMVAGDFITVNGDYNANSTAGNHRFTL